MLKKIKFGEYEFKNEVSINKVVKKLKSGELFYRKLSIIEGSSRYDLLKKIEMIYPNEEIKFDKLSSYIVADTYLYNIAEGPEKLIKNINKISLDISNKLWIQRDSSVPFKNFKDILILSSIVEKETHFNEEKDKIAGVFYNRIKNG